MIDVIIPCYNAHKHLKRCLGSIMAQKNIDEIEVTLVNDGGEDYTEIVNQFFPLINIKEIGYEENKGPGYARNFGLKNTHNTLLTFIDADDTFTPFGLYILKQKLIEHPKYMIVSGAFYMEEIKPKFKLTRVEPNEIWFHGKMYKRCFFEKYNLELCLSRANEDVGFNNLCRNILRSMPEEDTSVNEIVYNWQYNSSSLVRSNPVAYKFTESSDGFINNMIWAYKEAEKRGINTEGLLIDKVESFIKMCEVYNDSKKEYPEATQQLFNLSKQYYEEILKDVEDKVTLELFYKIYQDVYQIFDKDGKRIRQLVEFLKEIKE